MVRGHAKEQAKQKNAAAKAKAERSGTQLGAADKAMNYTCVVCKTAMPGAVLLKMHYESKHPKDTIPAEILAEIAAAEAKKAAAKAPAAGGDAKPKAAEKPKKKKDDGLGALLAAGVSGGKKK